MLKPEQVIPFLRHEDDEVRQHAVLYLAGANDPAPATADDFWRAIDALGQDTARSHLSRLELMPQTDDSVGRTLAALPAAEGDFKDALLRVLRTLDFALLGRHRDAIFAVENLPEEVREHLGQRLALADEPVEPLWDRLMALAGEMNGRDFNERDALAVERLIEAMARRPDVFTDRTVALLRDESVKDWREVMAADLAGEMRLRDPAVLDALIDKFREDEGDILWETAAEAVVRSGDPSVADRIADRFGNEEWGFRISAAGALGRIKHPDAEAALIRLIEAEEDGEVCTFLAASLLDLCPTDAGSFESVRQMILSERYEPGTADLKSMLITAGKMGGYEPPEAKAWQEQLAADRKRWESGAADADGLLARLNDRLRSEFPEEFATAGQILGLPDSRPLPPLRPPIRQRREAPGRGRPSGYAPAKPGSTIRRPSAKVGRNDPCPCGSGRKFKKCCMRD